MVAACTLCLRLCSPSASQYVTTFGFLCNGVTQETITPLPSWSPCVIWTWKYPKQSPYISYKTSPELIATLKFRKSKKFTTFQLQIFTCSGALNIAGEGKCSGGISTDACGFRTYLLVIPALHVAEKWSHRQRIERIQVTEAIGIEK